MKKFISTFFIFSLLIFTTNKIGAFADSKLLSQGIHNVKDVQLSTGINYSVRNTSPSNKSLLLIIDSNRMVQELLRLEPNSPKYILKPLNYGDLIVIVGASNLEFS